jgi:hypothetical protein
MSTFAAPVETHSLVIAVGGVAVAVHTCDPGFLETLRNRYADFVSEEEIPEYHFDVELISPRDTKGPLDLQVSCRDGRWLVERGDFRAELDPATRRVAIRQEPNAYSLDAVLRIVHTLVLARQGGFLLHAASAVRNGKAFLFAGVSGAGKTTISRLAPDDVTLLTDEISYLRAGPQGYIAHGTPFTGDLGIPGENTQAPAAALYLLEKGPQNRIDPVSVADAGRELLSNMLFFAEDPQLVNRVFETACDFAARVAVFRLTFAPDVRVWQLIG